MNFQEHHYRNLQRARDHLTETIISLESAAGRMTGDDWIDAMSLLIDISTDIGPRLARLRSSASARFDEHTRLDDFELMRSGQLPFPDERASAPSAAPTDRGPQLGPPPPRPPQLDAPNAKAGAALIVKHGGIDEAMKAYPPDSPEFDHIQAYRYVTSGKRPKGWIPPIV